jgi:hypothetical protein
MSDAEDPSECLPATDVELVRPFLEEFKLAKKAERKNIIRKAVTTVMAAREVVHLKPLAQGKLIAKVREVSNKF